MYIDEISLLSLALRMLLEALVVSEELIFIASHLQHKGFIDPVYTILMRSWKMTTLQYNVNLVLHIHVYHYPGTQVLGLLEMQSSAYYCN